MTVLVHPTVEFVRSFTTNPDGSVNATEWEFLLRAIYAQEPPLTDDEYTRIRPSQSFSDLAHALNWLRENDSTFALMTAAPPTPWEAAAAAAARRRDGNARVLPS